MKKKIFLVLLFIHPPLFSQPKFAVGGRIGVNIANVVSNELPGKNEESRTGVNFGAVGTMSLNPNSSLFLVGEVLFNQKGGKNYASGSNSLTYIDVPILLRHTFNPKKDFPLQIFINAGPYLGFMVARTIDPIPGSNLKKGSANALEMGLCIGGGILYPIGPGNIFVEYRYSFALSSLISESLERNRISTISVGYLFNLNGKSQEVKDKAVESGFEEEDEDKGNSSPKEENKPKEKVKKKSRKDEKTTADEQPKEKVKKRSKKEEEAVKKPKKLESGFEKGTKRINGD